MFFSSSLPASSNETMIFWLIMSKTDCETQIPSGCAAASRRAAILTASPKRLSSVTMTSPRLIPTRNSIRNSSGTSSLSEAMRDCISTAQRAALTGLANSAMMLSPAEPKIFPSCSATTPSMTCLRRLRSRSVYSSLAAIILLNPTTSEARIVLSLRSTDLSPYRPRTLRSFYSALLPKTDYRCLT